MPFEQACHLAQLGRHAGGDHQPAPAPVGRRRPLERHVEPLTQPMRRTRQHTRVLVHRDRFTGQCRLIHLELRNLQ